jgi:hypothetical protein
MKEPLKLFFYSHISSHVSTYADGEKWTKIAEKTTRFLNTELGDDYPDVFFYLKAKIRGGYKYYAGSVADPGQWNDARFTDIIQPPDPSGDKLYQGDRRKGN